MKQRTLLIVCICAFLNACVQNPVFRAGDYALVKSDYPIVSINGIEVEPVYKQDIKAGENTLVIVYNTYQYDYSCTFSWAAAATTVYEIVDQDNSYPLTLYRWVRKNSLWAIRLDPVDPVQCAQDRRR